MKNLPLLAVAALGTVACSTIVACSTTEAQTAKPSAAVQNLAVIVLQNAAADEVARALNRIWPGTRLVADARTNSVILAYSSEAELVKLSECIAKLDVAVQPTK